MGTTTVATGKQGSTTGTALSPANQFRKLLDSMKSQIAVALPRHLTAERMIRVVMTAVQRTPELLECSQMSLIGSIIQASQLGLEPDGVQGQAYLVPFKNKHTGQKECQLIPGYRGLMTLARRSGEIADVMAEVVYENDKFTFSKGLEPKLEHVPTMDADPGKMIGAYAVAFFKDKDTRPHFEFMWKGQIDGIMARSKASNFGPWKTDYEAMAKKTVVRQLCKWLPMSVEYQTVATLDDQAEQSITHVDFDVTPNAPAIATTAPSSGSKLDQLTDKLKSESETQGVLLVDDGFADDLATSCVNVGLTGAKLRKALKDSFGVEQIIELTAEQANQFAVALKGMPSV